MDGTAKTASLYHAWLGASRNAVGIGVSLQVLIRKVGRDAPKINNRPPDVLTIIRNRYVTHLRLGEQLARNLQRLVLRSMVVQICTSLSAGICILERWRRERDPISISHPQATGKMYAYFVCQKMAGTQRSRS